MVIATCLAALAVAAPVGVVQVARGASVAAAEARPGQLLEPGERVSVIPGGWAELSLVGDPAVVARLSAGAELGITQDGLRLVEGRLWLRATGHGAGAAKVHLPEVTVVVPAGAAVVVEHSRSAGTLVAVRAGVVRVATSEPGAGVSLGRAQVLRVAGGGAVGTPQAGGAALGELVSEEAWRALPDLAGVQAYLRDEGARVRRGLGRAGLGPVVRGPAEVLGADGGTVGALIEDALRPPPFFAEEVPPKGPNLQVEVRFE
ncbi:MAG: hypothetical protein H6730_35280 [Deltaproteobacteria bacterium]|nr:hypothetical protein [Deltaproteobacteria bacterium]